MKIYCCNYENIEGLYQKLTYLKYNKIWIHPKEAINFYSWDEINIEQIEMYESNPIVIQYLIKHKDRLKVEFYWFDGENLELLEDCNKLFTEQAEMISKLI